MSSIIINADDFGLTRGVTRGIIACAASGIVRSTSVMTCVPEAETLVKEFAGRSSIGFGIHLQLTQGRPVLPAEDIPSLVDERGCFPTRRTRAGMSPVEIAKEWKAQLQRLRDWGVEPDHIDTHHHLHELAEHCPEILVAYAAFAAETRLPARGGSRKLGRFLKSRGVSCSDVVIHLSEIKSDGDALLSVLENERAANSDGLVVEVCCHPGFVDADLAAVTLPKYLAVREKELALLSDPALRSRLSSAGWDIVRYCDLQRLGMADKDG